MAGTALLQGLKLRPVTPEDHAHNLRVLMGFFSRLLPYGARQLPSMTTAERDAIPSPAELPPCSSDSAPSARPPRPGPSGLAGSSVKRCFRMR